MQRIAAQCEGTELTRFPCLRDRIVEVREEVEARLVSVDFMGPLSHNSSNKEAVMVLLGEVRLRLHLDMVTLLE